MTLLLRTLAVLAGLAVGSFVTTAALRAVQGRQALTGRSACDACGQSLTFAQTLPLISYAHARGACQRCAGRIDPIHPGGELVGGIGGLVVTYVASPVSAVGLAGLGLILLATSVIDIRTRKLPDSLTLAAAAIGVFLAWRHGSEAMITGLTAALISLVVLIALRAASQALQRGVGLGLGDVKLVCALALWLGVLTPWAIVIASGLGLAVALKWPAPDGRTPFGPMICAGAWMVGATLEAGWWRLT